LMGGASGAVFRASIFGFQGRAGAHKCFSGRMMWPLETCSQKFTTVSTFKRQLRVSTFKGQTRVSVRRESTFKRLVGQGGSLFPRLERGKDNDEDEAEKKKLKQKKEDKEEMKQKQKKNKTTGEASPCLPSGNT